jgi:hypothetical protein
MEEQVSHLLIEAQVETQAFQSVEHVAEHLEMEVDHCHQPRWRMVKD